MEELVQKIKAKLRAKLRAKDIKILRTNEKFNKTLINAEEELCTLKKILLKKK